MKKDDHWFRERYDPELLYKWKREQHQHQVELARKFMEQLDQYVKGLKLIEDPAANYADLNLPVASAPLFGFDSNAQTLYLK